MDPVHVAVTQPARSIFGPFPVLFGDTFSDIWRRGNNENKKQRNKTKQYNPKFTDPAQSLGSKACMLFRYYSLLLFIDHSSLISQPGSPPPRVIVMV
jgi:hypothetical protein